MKTDYNEYNKRRIEEILIEKMNKELDNLVKNASKLKKLTAVSIIGMKQPTILLFLSILSDYKRVSKENEELKEKYDKDTHTLQNQLDIANADIAEKDKIIDLMALAISSYDGQLVINQYKDRNEVKAKFEEYVEDGTYEQYFENKAEEIDNK